MKHSLYGLALVSSFLVFNGTVSARAVDETCPDLSGEYYFSTVDQDCSIEVGTKDLAYYGWDQLFIPISTPAAVTVQYDTNFKVTQNGCKSLEFTSSYDFEKEYMGYNGQRRAPVSRELNVAAPDHFFNQSFVWQKDGLSINSYDKRVRHYLPIAPEVAIPIGFPQKSTEINTVLKKLPTGELSVWTERKDENGVHVRFSCRVQKAHAWSLEDAKSRLDRELALSVLDGKLDRMTALLDSGANPNSTHTKFARPLLYIAATARGIDPEPRMAMVRALVEHGADVNAHDVVTDLRNGFTVLMGAAEAGQAEVARYLIEKGADVNRVATGYCENTALWEAAYEGAVGVIQALIDAKVDLNRKGCSKETPLKAAITNHQTAAADLLRAAGARE